MKWDTPLPTLRACDPWVLPPSSPLFLEVIYGFLMEIQQKYFPSLDVLPHFSSLPFDPIIVYLIFYPSFQTLLLPLNLLFPSMETGFNPLAFCDASRLQSGTFISEITPNLPHCRNIGDVEDITHSSLLLHCKQCEIPQDNVHHVLACRLLDSPTLGLSCFWLILLLL